MASRRFTSTLGAGTGTGAAFAIAATACLNDAGTTQLLFRLLRIIQLICKRHSST